MSFEEMTKIEKILQKNEITPQNLNTWKKLAQAIESKQNKTIIEYIVNRLIDGMYIYGSSAICYCAEGVYPFSDIDIVYIGNCTDLQTKIKEQVKALVVGDSESKIHIRRFKEYNHLFELKFYFHELCTTIQIYKSAYDTLGSFLKSVDIPICKILISKESIMISNATAEQLVNGTFPFEINKINSTVAYRYSKYINKFTITMNLPDGDVKSKYGDIFTIKNGIITDIIIGTLDKNSYEKINVEDETDKTYFVDV